MIILAFDTCLGAVSAAVVVDGRVTGRLEPCPTGHAERLLPVIRSTMADAGIVFADIQRVAVTLGPGGFTGLRVGISAARAFGLALDVPVVGVSSLEIVARGVGPQVASRLAVAASAGRAGTYVQIFDMLPFRSLGHPFLLSADETDPRLATATAVGPGAASLAGRVADVSVAHLDYQPDAAVLAHLAADLPPLREVRPVYLRAPDAKPQTGKGLARAFDSRQT